jgi:hypothetical protein
MLQAEINVISIPTHNGEGRWKQQHSSAFYMVFSCSVVQACVIEFRKLFACQRADDWAQAEGGLCVTSASE